VSKRYRVVREQPYYLGSNKETVETFSSKEDAKDFVREMREFHDRAWKHDYDDRERSIDEMRSRGDSYRGAVRNTLKKPDFYVDDTDD
jgi:hypothetical protein